MPLPERVRLAHLPTPLDPAPALGGRLGCQVLFKRDDATGLGMGGNKARKLEYLLADARAKGADTLVTFGGVQSNHARMTAAAAARCGLGCRLILAGPRPGEETGNLLLDRLFGAEAEFLGLTPSDLSPERVERARLEAEERLRREGKRPYWIPAGGTSPLGVLAYALAFQEMLDQAQASRVKVETVVAAMGSGGTFCGLALGNVLAGRPVRVLGISVAPPGLPEAVGIPPFRSLVEAAAPLALEAARSGRQPAGAGPGPADGRAPVEIRPEDVAVDFAYAGPAYAAPTPESLEAIHLVARAEGVLLDPVYTSKAMAGLIDLARKREIGREGAVVFFHTGGTPALFAYAEALLGGPRVE